MAPHASIFSYSLSRPYPFKWFTPTVLVGAVVATVLFSFLNVAATGYEMNTVESSNPNVTTADRTFFSNWPAFMAANTRPSCDAKVLGVSNTYYTNNTAFSYKLESISKQVKGGSPLYFGDISYYNNALRNCTIPNIEVHFEGIQRNAHQIAVQQWGAELLAHIVCTIDTPEGSMKVNLSTTYDVNSYVDRFPGRNATTKSSLWWGESLLAWYYVKLTSDMSIATQALARQTKDPVKIYKGYVGFKLQKDPIVRPSDIQSPNFFQSPFPECFYIQQNDGPQYGIQYCRNENGKWILPLEGILPTAATLTKVFHSTILTDLGQDNPNILSDQSLLKYFSENITAIAAQQIRAEGSWGWGNNLKIWEYHPELAQGPYTSQNASSWRLGTEPSFMAVSYLCQVPRMKSTSSLIFSVLIANLVFLQVLWKVFVLVVDFFMYRRDSDMGSCQGCQSAQVFSEVGLETLRRASTVSNLGSKPKYGTTYSPLAAS
jgi:hypothetical protein